MFKFGSAIIKLVIVLVIIILFKMCFFSSANIDYVKEKADAKWEKQGFEVVDYEGYQVSTAIPFTKYGGAHVWYRLRKIPDNGITYSGSLKQWGDEIHVYGPMCIDAIKPQ